MGPSTDSFLRVGNPTGDMSIISDPVTNDWTNLYKRPYSEASNRISDTRSDSFLSSVHGSSQGIPEGWERGANYAVETEITAEDTMYMSHVQGEMLIDMSTQGEFSFIAHITS
jgi:hypothetical protein